MGDLAPFFAPGAGGRTVVPYYINPSVVGDMLTPFIPRSLPSAFSLGQAAKAVYHGYQIASNPMRLSAGRPIQRLVPHKAAPPKVSAPKRTRTGQQKVQQTIPQAVRRAQQNRNLLMKLGFGNRRLNRFMYLNRFDFRKRKSRRNRRRYRRW